MTPPLRTYLMYGPKPNYVPLKDARMPPPSIYSIIDFSEAIKIPIILYFVHNSSGMLFTKEPCFEVLGLRLDKLTVVQAYKNGRKANPEYE